MRIMSFDPGDSTGIIRYDGTTYEGLCIYKNFGEIEESITSFKPDLIIIETFQLYPGKAMSMSWNTFYPCEVIGVIKHTAEKLGIRYEMQSAGIKPFSKIDANCPKGNDHVKDAYRHIWHYLHLRKGK